MVHKFSLMLVSPDMLVALNVNEWFSVMVEFLQVWAVGGKPN